MFCGKINHHQISAVKLRTQTPSLLISLGLSLLLLGWTLVGCTRPSLGSNSASDSTPSPSTASDATADSSASSSNRPDSSFNVTPPRSSSDLSQRAQRLPISAQVVLAGETFELEVAATARQQAIGLMFRPSIPDNQGMLFPFEPPRPVNFWMRNVQVPLDMVFIRQGEIVAIAHSVPPCTTPTCPTYGPDAVVDHVLELRGGRAEELGLSAGDTLDIQFLEANQPAATP